MWYTQAEYNIAHRSLLQSPGNIMYLSPQDLDKKVRNNGYLIDRELGLPQAEANAKWGTEWFTEPKGGAMAVVGGAVTGFLTGGPVGLVIGAAGGAVAAKKMEDKAKADAKSATAGVNAAIEEVKNIATQTQAAKTLQANANPLMTDIVDNIKNPFVVGGLILLVLLLIFAFYKSQS